MEAKPERLQKILAAAGLASRRKAEELIAAGLVSVNGHVITELGTKADPRLDEIRVEGKLLRGPERHVYLVMYKPKGYMTTVRDPEGRPTVMDLLKGVEERVFPVGRLDYMSEGLLLLTNDGDLMAQLTRAGSHVPKTYMVKVSGKPTEEAIDKLRGGIMLPPEPGLAGARGKKQPGVERRSFAVLTQPATIELAVDQENPWFEVTLTEGRNRQLRRMFEQIGHHIEKIKRIRYGSLTLDLEPGEFRYLAPKEVNQLRRSLEAPARLKPVQAKRKQLRPERAERKPRIDAARFVKGRRGKPSQEAPAAAFAQRAERTPSRGFAGPRGPEFARKKRQEEGAPRQDFAAKRRFAGKPAGSPAGKPTRRAETEFGFERESKVERRQAPGRGKAFGFDRFANPKFAKVGKRREQESGEGSGLEARKPFGAGKAFRERPYSNERAAAGERGDKRARFAKPGADRRFSKGPGKPRQAGAHPEGGTERGQFERGEFKRRTMDRGDEGRGGGRGPKHVKGFAGPQASNRPRRGDFKRPSGGAGSRPSTPARGGATRPSRRRPEHE